MATTSIWSVKSTLGHVIEYAEDGTKTANPKWSKSEYQSMRDIMDYAMNDFKTEQQYYVTALNCDAGCAREQMQLTKRQLGGKVFLLSTATRALPKEKWMQTRRTR